ncbi:polyhydroxyalkanoic acid system family protein [Variovorax robiniae]|uniref:Polyhydroxyalkanoic acid system family protein n=1 Tax=Variovorax robiniae TaxID=1836199 RepID=A0ABU8X6N2_9BURK
MSDIHIERNHTLGLEGAREVARGWLEKVESEYGMDCKYSEGWVSDTAKFSRPGAEGTLRVTEDNFTLRMTLGFLMESYARQIEEQITRNLDDLLGDADTSG